MKLVVALIGGCGGHRGAVPGGACRPVADMNRFARYARGNALVWTNRGGEHA